MNKREALRFIDNAIQQLESANRQLHFSPYPDSVKARELLGLDRCVTVEGNHGRDSVGWFPTERGKRLDALRIRLGDLKQELSTLYDEIIA